MYLVLTASIARCQELIPNSEFLHSTWISDQRIVSVFSCQWRKNQLHFSWKRISLIILAGALVQVPVRHDVTRIVVATCVFASASALRLRRAIKYSWKPSLFIKLTCAIPHAKYQKCVHYSRCAPAISLDEAVRWHTVRERSDNYALAGWDPAI